MNSETTVIFQHIPKTAGTTVISILEREYPKEKRYKVDAMDLVNSLKDFEELAKKGKTFNLIYGHLSEQLIPHIDQKVVRFSFLRNPVELFVSSFFYIKRATWNRNHEEVSKMKSIHEYIDFCDTNNLFNLQTRYLSENIDYLYENTNPSKTVDEDDFERAKENLDKIDYVLDLKNFDASILALANHLNWKKVPYYRRRNATSNRKKVTDLDSDVREKLNGLLKYDLALYQGLNEKDSIIDGVSDRALKKFRYMNSLREKFRIG